MLSLAFVLVPFIPGVRTLPRRIPIYKLIWREHYRAQATAAPQAAPHAADLPVEPSGSAPA